MTVSWFGGDGADQDPHRRISIKEAVKVLYPQRRWNKQATTNRSRFSTLLLEHGERHIQDWAVIGNSAPAASHSGSELLMTPRSSSTHWAQATTTSTGAHTSSSKSKSKKKKKRQLISKESYPTVHLTKCEGRLHLCSRSLVFEPNDVARPMVRCPMSKMSSPPMEYPHPDDLRRLQETSDKFDETLCVQVQSTKHFLLPANHAIGPVESVPVSTTFRWTFLHSSPKPLVELSQELIAIQKKHGSSPSVELEQLLRPMYDRPFDQTSLLDVREESSQSSPLRCHWFQPLQSQPGCIVLTQERLYFQPAKGVLGLETTTVSSWWLSQLAATARRYKGLQDSALELYWKDGTSTLLAFERKHEREQVLRLLPLHVPCHTDRDFLLQASQEWQSGALSNFEYLLLLNSAAGRTLQDLSRYPVFPWVISDFESKKLDLTNPATFRDLTKPVGALNPDRLAYFQERFESMDHDAIEGGVEPFLYGTHYSAAGYVLYYLVRSMPEHMLCLQNGKFDAPDRMFHSLSKCYSCVMTNHADVKELIPEFYNPNLDYDFLINVKGLQLGATQTGDRVNDVDLPPWAKSPRDFLRKNAKALESDICTAMLPRWIDLIFGSKSRGDAARESSNLFHKYAYFGPSELSNMPTQEERFQAELHATEFGLVPDQLFIGPHPLRHETVDDSFISSDIGRTFSGTDDVGKGDAWELLEPPSSGHLEHQDSQDDDIGINPLVQPSESSDNLLNRDDRYQFQNDQNRFRQNRPDRSLPLSGTGDQSAGTGAFSTLRQEASLSNVSSTSAVASQSLNSPAQSTDTQPGNSASAEWDIKFFEKSRVHEDAISGCAIVPHGGPNQDSLVVTSSLDGGLKINTVTFGATKEDEAKKQSQGFSSTLSRFSYITMSRGQNNESDERKLTEYRSHTSRDPLACLAMAGDGHGGKVAFAGGHDDVVLAYGINSACAVASVYSHRDAVTGLDMLVRPALIPVSPLWLEQSTHIMVSGSWDATVKVWSVTVANGETVSINREPLAELFDADSSIVCVSAATIPGVGGLVIAAGCADGSFCVWKLHNDGVKVVIHKETARRGSGPCSVVRWSVEGEQLTLFTGFSTGKVASFTLVDESMRKVSAASVGVAVLCLVYSENILLVGCADGGLRLIPIRDGANFTSDLSLWPAVNGKSSPGISSVTVSFVGNPATGSGKCVCCTGAEDGSIALFELKRVVR